MQTCIRTSLPVWRLVPFRSSSLHPPGRKRPTSWFSHGARRIGTAWSRLGNPTVATLSFSKRFLTSTTTPTLAKATPAAETVTTPASDASTETVRSSSIIPVGIFVDLDNVVPTDAADPDGVLRRPAVAATFRPLLQFGRAVAGDRSVLTKKQRRKALQAKAFANEPTQTYQVPNDRRELETAEALLEQEWWESSLSGSDQDLNWWEDDNSDDDDLFPGAMVQTGYDETGNLRCGVCGAKMKLNKKDKARGWTELDKLNKHMKMLHDREQSKRSNRVKSMKSPKKKQKLLQGKMGLQMEKYKAAQVGLNRNVSPSTGTPRKDGKKSNQLFTMLKEEGFDCVSCNDVDKTLMRHARKWLKKETSRSDSGLRGIMVVVSEDSDFFELLQEARKKGLCVVTAAPNSLEQTKKLVQVSDLVLVRNDEEEGRDGGLVAEAQSPLGAELLDELPSPAIFRVRLGTAATKFLGGGATTDAVDARIAVHGLIHEVNDEDMEIVNQSLVSSYNEANGAAGYSVSSLETKTSVTIPDTVHWSPECRWCPPDDDAALKEGASEGQLVLARLQVAWSPECRWCPPDDAAKSLKSAAELANVHRTLESAFCAKPRNS